MWETERAAEEVHDLAQAAYALDDRDARYPGQEKGRSPSSGDTPSFGWCLAGLYDSMQRRLTQLGM